MKTIRFASTLLLVNLLLAVCLFCGPAWAGCADSDVWAAFPATDDLTSQGLPVNEQLINDSGPSVNKDATKTYSRMWQGGSSSWGASVTLTIHPDAKLAADDVQKYGDGLIKGSAGVQVKIGDLGFKTDDLMRPYYKIQKGCLVATFYTSSPRRTMVGDQDQVVAMIVGKLAALTCCQGGSSTQNPPTANKCPVINSSSFSPSKPTPNDTILFTGSATDPEGDKIDYTWSVFDFNQTKIERFTGATASWKNPPEGNYMVRMIVKDGDPNCADWRDHNLVVLGNQTLANQPPTIRLSYSPHPPLTTGDVTFTAVVTDPDGDSIRGGWGHTNTGGVSGGKYPDTQKIPGTSRPCQPVKTRNGDTFTWSCRVNAGPQKMTFGAEDVRGGKAQKTVSLVVIDPVGPLDITLLRTPSNYYIPYQTVDFKVVDNAPAGETLTYAWWIDGKRDKSWTAAAASWSNPPAGRHEVTVQAWKKSGETDTEKTSFEITGSPPPPPPAKNNPPAVRITLLTKKPTVGKPVSFKADVTDKDTNDTHVYIWRIGGQVVGSASVASWKPNAPGRYTVTAKVSDGTDSATDSLSFTVEDPQAVNPPPPFPKKRPSIIRSAALFHANAIHGYGSAAKFQAGERIGLRLEVLPSSPQHRIEVRWIDPAGKRIQSRTLALRGNVGNQTRIAEDFLATGPADATGNWNVEIAVDGRFDRTANFVLDGPGSGFARPGRAPSATRPSSIPINPPPSNPPQPSSSGGGWKKAF